MEKKAFGLLKCKVLDTKKERDLDNPHYQIHVKTSDIHYRVTVNIRSQLTPSELLVYTTDSFAHDITQKIDKLEYDFFENPENSIDYVRENYGFKKNDMAKIPYSKSGPNNDLNEILDHYFLKAKQQNADLYVYGTRWLPKDENEVDSVFGFKPSYGMHDIHMNQGNCSKWYKDDATYKDGCLLIHYKDHWAGIFLAFQSQSFNTDDDGHRINK